MSLADAELTTDGLGAPAGTPRHRINVEGAAASFTCAEDVAVLIAMERAGVRAIPVGCRGGGCGFCRVRVLSGRYVTGRMSREHVAEADERAGYALACRLYPRGALELALATEVAAARRVLRAGGRESMQD